jgi:hypothetical protein
LIGLKRIPKAPALLAWSSSGPVAAVHEAREPAAQLAQPRQGFDAGAPGHVQIEQRGVDAGLARELDCLQPGLGLEHVEPDPAQEIDDAGANREIVVRAKNPVDGGHGPG